MAIINSLAIGKSVKSAGNLTYKTVRGRTIASQRITTNKSKTFLQITQRGRFATLSKCMQLMQAWIDNTYEKSKYGSSRNQFATLNKNFRLNGRYNNIIGGTATLLSGFAGSFANGNNDKALQCRFVSYGSYPAIVNETVTMLADFSVADEGFAHLKNCSRYDITLPKGIDYSKIELRVFGLTSVASSFRYEVVKLKLLDNGSVVIDKDSSVIISDIIMESSNVTASNGLVTGLSIVYNTDKLAVFDASFVVPFFEGRTIKLSAPSFKQPMG